MSEIAILIPVLDRPERAYKVVESIRSSSCERHRVLFLCSPRDKTEIYACRHTDADVHVVDWEPGPGDFARKTNLGYAMTDEPFVFCGADDLTFEPGWDIETLTVAAQTGAGVIGTWDGANPKTMSGQHATHSLVRRAYIEDWGGTIDGTGAIYSELYDHQCVDNELVEIAELRSQWAFAREARVLHHHPIYDRTVAMDDTYRKALAHGRDDIALFMQRRRLWRKDPTGRGGRVTRSG